jgi:uncharacterized phage protein gp47/JayE
MALPQLNIPFVPATQEQIRDAILADYRLEMIKTTGLEPAVQPGTEAWCWATAHAGISMLEFSNIELSRDAITPLNATGQDLENWRLALGLPEVKPSPSTGKIVVSVVGTSSLADGEPFTLPNGLRGKVSGAWAGLVEGSEVDAVTVDTGSATVFDGGTPVRFVAPPLNINTAATVSRNSPLRGGLDKENDDRKRSRILNTLANKPGGGNWGQMRQIALDALASVQDCYVYPALGGPASAKVVPVRDFDPSKREFTRVMSAAALTIVRTALYNQLPDGIEVVVEAPADQPVDVALTVTIPLSSLQGGNGNGWVDQLVWPNLSGDTKVTVTGVTSSNVITVSALTATAPISGQTHIVWWSPKDRKFRQYLVTAVTGGSGAWVLTLDRPLIADDGTLVATGDYISPAAVNSISYGTSWVNSLRAIGPAENTTDANRIPRAKRHPYIADQAPSDLTFLMLQSFRNGHPEVTDINWSARSATTPTVPASVASFVNVFVPQHFGIYST